MNDVDMYKNFTVLVAVVFFSCSSVFSTEVDFRVFSVGQANFTMMLNKENALVFDCGYGTGCRKSDWVDTEEFTTAKKNVLSKLLKGVSHIVAVISHKHADHYNLLESFKKLVGSLSEKLIAKGKGPLKLEVAYSWDDSLKNLKEDSLGSEISIVPFIAKEQGPTVTIHDKCLVLKVIIKGDRERSILLTGDASGKSCEAMEKSDESLLQNIDILMLSHHGSSKENALNWFKMADSGCAAKPMLSIISSDSVGKDSIPTFEMIK